MSPPNINKGSRIRASWFQAYDHPHSLAGVMLKTGATKHDVTGICRHFRGDAPVNPTTIRVYIDPDPGTWDGPTMRPPGCTCDHGHVDIDPDHIIAVL